jgi:uncharacterized protein
MTSAHNPRTSGWPHADSPYHSAELELQEKFGARARLDVGGRLGIRDYMLDQHRQFFEAQPFLLLGVSDTDGQPWASIVHGHPGFIRSLDPRLLNVRALPLPGDPAREALRDGARIGTLGIEPATRRRNRMNGDVDSVSSESFSVNVVQSYGNCPQYIQARKPWLVAEGNHVEPGASEWASSLSDEDMALLGRTDTFFIATACEPGNERTRGVDVSHRGGKPGFIHVDSPQGLTTPDFRGNFFFNTLGNLAVDPRAGLLVIDFNSGDLLQMAAIARVIWSGPEVDQYMGAQRLVRFQVVRVRRARAALPFRWGEVEPAPQLASTGDW